MDPVSGWRRTCSSAGWRDFSGCWSSSQVGCLVVQPFLVVIWSLIHPTYSTTELHLKAGFCFYIFVFQTKDSSRDSNKGIREWFHGEFDPHPICYLLPLLKGNMCMWKGLYENTHTCHIVLLADAKTGSVELGWNGGQCWLESENWATRLLCSTHGQAINL